MLHRSTGTSLEERQLPPIICGFGSDSGRSFHSRVSAYWNDLLPNESSLKSGTVSRPLSSSILVMLLEAVTVADHSILVGLHNGMIFFQMNPSEVRDC